MSIFSKIISKSKENKIKRVPIVVCAEEEELIKALLDALKEDIIASPTLVGDAIKISEILSKHGKKIEEFKVVDIKTKEEASREAVDLVLKGKGDFLIKGLVDTSIILKAILNKKEEIFEKGKAFFSHVAVAELDSLDRTIVFGDAAMNILPDVEAKIKILENCYYVANRIGIEKPKIAILAAKEKVSEKMQATKDAAEITKILENDSRFIVEGPLAFDNAISERAAKVKEIKGKIQGDADIFIMPNIEAGNIFYKALCYLTKSKNAGILVGGKIPIVITSRADEEESKFLSIVLASVV